jgi:DNA-binding transcriptional LysR family regulator
MDREQLIAFERIVRVGSFSGAAAELGIAQPTISARIRVLEEAVGGDLFVRSGRRIALTEMGRALLPYARRIIDLLDEGLAATQAARVGQQGVLTLGLLDSLSEGFVSRSIARFRDTHPGVEMTVRSGTSQQIVEMLNDGAIRFGLIDWPYLDGSVEVLARFRERLVPVTLPSHPLARQGAVTFEEMITRANPLLLIVWNSMLTDAVRQHQPAPGATLEVPHAMARRLLRRRSGATFLPQDSITSDLDRGALAELIVSDHEPFYRDLALVRSKGVEPETLMIREFVEELLAAGREMVK